MRSCHFTNFGLQGCLLTLQVCHLMNYSCCSLHCHEKTRPWWHIWCLCHHYIVTEIEPVCLECKAVLTWRLPPGKRGQSCMKSFSSILFFLWRKRQDCALLCTKVAYLCLHYWKGVLVTLEETVPCPKRRLSRAVWPDKATHYNACCHVLCTSSHGEVDLSIMWIPFSPFLTTINGLTFAALSLFYFKMYLLQHVLWYIMLLQIVF